jgi:two-component system, sensor histidine kinase ChiS
MINKKSILSLMGLVIFILIAYPTSLSAQSIRFNRFMHINDGEPMGGPDTIVQDDLGYLWIATWGQRLFRYDGQTYLEYVSDLDDSSTISASNVKDILVGQNGIIWFATSNGVSRFNSGHNNFIRYKMPNEERSQLIVDIYEDHDGKIWVCNVDGEVFIYDKESNVFLSYTLPANQFFEEEPPVLKVFQDSSRDYWFILDQNGVLRYSPVDNHFYRYGESPGTEGDLSDYDIRLIYEDRKNTLWFGTINGGLNRYDRENDNFVSYPYNQNNSLGTSHRNIWNIYEDTHGNFWIATTSGLNLMNRKNETFQYYYSGDNPESLSEDWIVSICEDKGGNIWFGTGYSGLNMFNPKTLDFEHLEPGLFVWSVYEDEDQMLWIGTEKEGLHRRDLATGEKTVFYHDPDDDSTISNNIVYHMFEDSQNNIWVGTAFGLNKFDRDTGQFTRYHYDNSNDTSIPDPQILTLGENSSGTLWIGTNNGLAKYNRDSDNFTSYFHNPEDETSLNSNRIYSILDDSNGNLWVGTREGLNRMAYGSNSFIQYKSQKSGGPLIGDSVYDVYEGSDGSIYVSAGGFHKWIPEKDTFISISKEDGLQDNSCSQIFEDKSGNLWVSTFMGIVKISPDLVVLETYTYKDGLQANDFNSAAGWKNDEGYLYFGGFNGISRFLPENITPSAYTPPVVLTSLRIFDEEVLSGPWISTRQSIDVAWDENFFSFEFVAFDYRDSRAIEYAYKLEGYDEKWKYPGKRNYAGYTNIPGGKYTFLVKATNSDGIWTTEENYARLQVNISTHPLKTWWAITIYILCGIAALLVSFILYRKKQLLRLAIQEKEIKQEREAREKLEHIDRMKDAFLASTSHELRTPLNGIIGIAESLNEGAGGKLPKKAKHNLSMVISSGRRLASLVDDILDFSRLKEGELVLNHRPVNLKRLTEIVLALSTPLLAGRNIKLENKIPNDLPDAHGDVNRLQQIMHNFIGNAIKFTDEGSITISAKEADPGTNGSMLAVTITDTGIGIPKEKQEDIFKSFEQADDAISREYGGTGLGLSITKQLVELHNGNIIVESEPGRGSSFTFTIPASSEKADETDETSRLARLHFSSEETSSVSIIPIEESSSEDIQDIRILIVDDEPVNLQVLANHLSLEQYQVLLARSGSEALEICSKEPRPDVIILDIMMPRMDGYEVCQKLRENYPASELPVIMLTAKNQVQDLVEGLSVGANDYIAKPFSKNELLARIRTHLVLAKINIAYGHFVPHEFLDILNKRSIIDLRLGDQVQMDMTVMFADIRDFTSLSEKMTPEETFKFINSYLTRIVPVIRENEGFIDKYMGDGIMALFPDTVEASLQAAVDMQLAVHKFNQHRAEMNQKPIAIGVGVHTGTLILGTIGEEKRMQETVISDAVNLASRVEGLSKLYGAPVVMSKQTMDLVINRKDFSFRFLGKIQVKGKEIPTSVYELLEGNPDRLKKLKTETRDEFEKGLELYYKQEFEEASLCFRHVLNNNPKDLAATLYRERAAGFIGHEKPEGWDGVEYMTGK